MAPGAEVPPLSPAWFDPVWSILTLAPRWLGLSVLVLMALWLMRRVAAVDGRVAPWPWWLSLLIGALVTAASWVAGRYG